MSDENIRPCASPFNEETGNARPPRADVDPPPSANPPEYFICSCVADDAVPVLRDVMRSFDVHEGGPPAPINLLRIDEACARYGRGPVSLILSLLEKTGHIEHAGNLTSSSFLTDDGCRLLDDLNA